MVAPQSHPDQALADLLKELRERLLLMSGRAEAMIVTSVRSLVEKDGELARNTIANDAKVNRAEMEIDELCLRVLSQHTPTKTELRFVALSLKMVTDLERIGDLAVNICERAVDLQRAPHLQATDELSNMAELVRVLVHDALDAFVSGDVELAQEVIDRDDDVDLQYKRLFVDVLEVMRDEPSMLEAGIHLQSAAKWLERIGDHATNIAEQVVFMIEGHDIRHAGKLPGSRYA